MKALTNLICLSALVFFLSTACGKNDGPSTTPPEEDTLGNAWQKISMPDSLDLMDVFFTNDATGYLGGRNYLAKSTDGGLTWNKFVLPDSMVGVFENIFFFDTDHGWVTAGAFILVTKNGGISWQKIRLRADNLPTVDIHFFSQTQGFATNSSGTIYKSEDGGLTWAPRATFTTDPPAGLFFFNKDSGWVCFGFLIRKTEDGAYSFPYETSLNPSGINYFIQFTDTEHGWVTGRNGIVSRTVDGGDTWVKITTNADWADFNFFDNSNGMLNHGGVIYSTADGGSTLKKEATIRKSRIAEIHFTNANHGWAVGDRGGLYRFVK